MIQKKDYPASLEYIRTYWKQVTCRHPKDKHLRFGLPYPYITPNDKPIFRNDQFYWDTYFVILGLTVVRKTTLAKGMINNFCYLYDRFRIIPMRNRYYNLGTSQIPFLTSMILEVYEHDPDKDWLKETAAVAASELKNYWMNDTMTEKHMVYRGLSRYCDHYITHLGAEHESGWDMTSRFGNHCLDYLPVDLNSCLYKYETDLATIYGMFNDKIRQKRYLRQAEARKATMHELMWNPGKKCFYDFNMRTEKQSRFLSVAGFYPLWAKLASPEQAELIVEHTLPALEYNGGIANTQSHGLSKETKQHDYPNGWPAQQWIVVRGLLNYGYREEAERIAKKWLDLNNAILEKTGALWEKYDVVHCKTGVFDPNRYPTQPGFSWTNAIFLRLLHEFDH